MPTHKPDLSRVSKSQLALLTGRDPTTVTKRLAAARVEPVAEDGRTLFYDPQLALAAIYLEGVALDPTAEKARLDSARADLAELELARRRGELINAEDAAAAGAAIASGVSQRIMMLRVFAPEIRAAASDAEGADLLEGACREALEEIANVGEAMGELARKAKAREERRRDAARTARGAAQ